MSLPKDAWTCRTRTGLGNVHGHWNLGATGELGTMILHGYNKVNVVSCGDGWKTTLTGVLDDKGQLQEKDYKVVSGDVRMLSPVSYDCGETYQVTHPPGRLSYGDDGVAISYEFGVQNSRFKHKPTISVADNRINYLHTISHHGNVAWGSTIDGKVEAEVTDLLQTSAEVVHVNNSRLEYLARPISPVGSRLRHRDLSTEDVLTWNGYQDATFSQLEVWPLRRDAQAVQELMGLDMCEAQEWTRRSTFPLVTRRYEVTSLGDGVAVQADYFSRQNRWIQRWKPQLVLCEQVAGETPYKPGPGIDTIDGNGMKSRDWRRHRKLWSDEWHDLTKDGGCLMITHNPPEAWKKMNYAGLQLHTVAAYMPMENGLHVTHNLFTGEYAVRRTWNPGVIERVNSEWKTDVFTLRTRMVNSEQLED